LTPTAGGDLAAAVVGILAIAVLGIAAALSASDPKTYSSRARLVSGTGVSLAIILFIWAVARGSSFVSF
jgi:hypothetical protein